MLWLFGQLGKEVGLWSYILCNGAFCRSEDHLEVKGANPPMFCWNMKIDSEPEPPVQVILKLQMIYAWIFCSVNSFLVLMKSNAGWIW